jgi:murein DD-endopeptidase MepM/ murein hydrolase activator NlpD
VWSPAQTAYKYRDASGQWVFTDNAPPAAAKLDSFSLNRQSETLQNTIERTDIGRSTRFTAINTCLCVATFLEKIVHSDDPDIPNGTEYRKILQPQSRELLVRVENAGAGKSNLQYMWTIALGSPDAKHQPPGPYRAPFAVGSTYMITQAYPSAFTHTAPDSQYAVDFGLPDGTPVYAAREGVVINVRHDAFRGGASPAMMDQANVVDILHDDGTIAMYAHLHWDSIRVHIGEHVSRGEYLANSGSTGFSTGPHLHFVVIRNAGFTAVSVPIEFAGPSGLAIVPVTQKLLTAY